MDNKSREISLFFAVFCEALSSLEKGRPPGHGMVPLHIIRHCLAPIAGCKRAVSIGAHLRKCRLVKFGESLWCGGRALPPGVCPGRDSRERGGSQGELTL